MKADHAKQQRARLAAGLLTERVKVRDEVRVTPCPVNEVQPRVRAMTPEMREVLTSQIDWLVAYEAEECLVWGRTA